MHSFLRQVFPTRGSMLHGCTRKAIDSMHCWLVRACMHAWFAANGRKEAIPDENPRARILTVLCFALLCFALWLSFPVHLQAPAQLLFVARWHKVSGETCCAACLLLQFFDCSCTMNTDTVGLDLGCGSQTKSTKGYGSQAWAIEVWLGLWMRARSCYGSRTWAV